MTEVPAITTVIPYAGLLRFLLCPTTQIMSQNKLCFPLKMLDCCLNLLLLPCGRSSPGSGWFARWSRESLLTIGRGARTVPTLCRRAPEG